MPVRKSWTDCDDDDFSLFDCNCWKQMLQCNCNGVEEEEEEVKVEVMMSLQHVPPPPPLSGRAASEAVLFAIC